MKVIFVHLAFKPGFPELIENPHLLVRDAKEKNGCLVGSWGAEIIKELKPKDNEILTHQHNP